MCRWFFLFLGLYTFFVCTILNSFRCFFICCSYCIVKKMIYVSFVNLYMFQVLSAGVRVLFDNFIVLKSSLDFLWKLLFTLRSLIFVPNQPCLPLMQLDVSIAVVLYCFLFNILKKLLFVHSQCYCFCFCLSYFCWCCFCYCCC